MRIELISKIILIIVVIVAIIAGAAEAVDIINFDDAAAIKLGECNEVVMLEIASRIGKEPVAKPKKPLNYYERCLEMIKGQCEEAGIAEYYTLVAAISRLETGNFTSNLFVNHNNWGGMKENGKFTAYESNFEGLHRYIAMMKSKIRKYGDNVEAMQKHYCPGSDTWAPKVRRIMKELEKTVDE